MQCNAFTKTGTRCHMRVKNGSESCWIHRDRVPAITQLEVETKRQTIIDKQRKKIEYLREHTTYLEDVISSLELSLRELTPMIESVNQMKSFNKTQQRIAKILGVSEPKNRDIKLGRTRLNTADPSLYNTDFWLDEYHEQRFIRNVFCHST